MTFIYGVSRVRWWMAVRWPMALFAFVFLAHMHGTMGCADSRWSIHTAVSVIDEGNFDLDEYLPTLRNRGFYFAEQIRGHYYTVYPFGASLLAVPAVVILRPVSRVAFRWWPSLRATLTLAQAARGCPPTDGEPVISLHSWTEQIIASAIVAASTVVIYAIARQELPSTLAACVALLFACGTSAWSTASRSLWQHGPLMLMLGLALLGQLRGWPLILVGVFLGFGYVVRPTGSLPLALSAAWVLLEYPRQSAPFSPVYRWSWRRAAAIFLEQLSHLRDVALALLSRWLFQRQSALPRCARGKSDQSGARSVCLLTDVRIRNCRSRP
jgi:hypothetical protein